MFGTIIVGVDGRQGGRDALALASVLAEATGSELMAANAFPYDSYPARHGTAAYHAALADESSKLLQAELAATGSTALPVSIGDTSPARGLHSLAEQRSAGLIVIGSPHEGRVRRMLMGDATHGTLAAAPCAVAVAPEGFTAGGLETIGVGFDDTPESRRAFDLAVDLARVTGARLEVVSAIDISTQTPMFKSYLSAEHIRKQAMEAAEEALAAALAGVDVPASSAVVEDAAATALSELSGRVDLLVLGSRNWGPVRRLMVGSTSHAVVAHAEGPVLVLPRGEEAGATMAGDAAESVSQPTA